MATAAHLKVASARFEIPQDHPSTHGKDLRAGVAQALQRGDRYLVVDCRGWNQLDVSILSSLIQCFSWCREHGASFELANISSEIRANVAALSLSSRLGLD